MNITRSTFAMLLISALTLFSACESTTNESSETVSQEEEVNPPASTLDWAKNANIYEVNVRQYTPEGTFTAFAEHLPRLKEMGVKILWFMPIYPISEKNRKGSLGSYYAISDYTAVNPNFGTMEEFKDMLNDIHEMGMKVILDWVPNHTGWDHAWITDHPDFYTKNAAGEITDPIKEDGESWGWTDVADLNYDNTEMRKEMIGDMKFWLTEVGVDGFRCDVASEVPDDFWSEVTAAFESLDPVFMLAEAEHPPHRNLGNFEMSYGWSFHHVMNDIAKEEKTAADVKTWYEEDRAKYKQGYHMHFTTNHDENSWNGTIEERLGDGGDAFNVLAFTFDGMPLIYSGQEAGLNRRLLFFEKDSIDWGEVSKQKFYTTLLQLKAEHPALWNGADGGEPTFISTSNDESILAFKRQKEEDQVVVILNLSDRQQDFKLASGGDYTGDYTNVFGNSGLTLTDEMEFQLGPWDYLVLAK